MKMFREVVSVLLCVSSSVKKGWELGTTVLQHCHPVDISRDTTRSFLVYESLMKAGATTEGMIG